MAAQVAGRVPPSSLEAEQSILGSVLLSQECALIALEKLKEEDFYTEAHRAIWRAMVALAGSTAPIDLVTVTEQMEKGGRLSLEQLTYLNELSQRVPSVRNLPSYISIVKEKSLLRKLLLASGEIGEMCFTGEMSAREAVDYASQLIYDLTQGAGSQGLVHISEAIQDSYAQIAAAAKNKGGLMGTATGFPMMDRKLSGFQPSQLIVVAGRPGMGKTSFALNIAEHIGLKEDKPVVIFSLEMSAEQLASRMMCAVAHVDSQAARNGELKDEDYFAVAEAMEPLGKARIYISDNPTAGPTEILSQVRRLKQKLGDIGLVIIDYLQLMTLPGRNENRQQEVSTLSRSLKILARELQVPVLLLSQLSRETEKRKDKRPALSDLRESGAIEQDADVVLFLHREEYYNQEDPTLQGKAQIIIAKQRSGPVGTIDVMWKGEQTKYQEVDYTHMEE